MQSERHIAGLDVIASVEAVLHCDDEGLAVILDNADLRAFAEMAATVLAVVLSGAAPDPDELLARFRQHFSEV
jgi:hypothetical protein